MKIQFLPANTTFKIHPLDQEIVKILKTIKKCFFQSILAAMGTTKSASELAKTVTVLQLNGLVGPLKKSHLMQ